MKSYRIEFSKDKCYITCSIISTTVNANSSQEAVDWFRKNYTNADKYTIHDVLEIKTDWH